MILMGDIYARAPYHLRTLFLNSYAIFLNLERYGKKFDRLFREFEDNEKMSFGELQEYQRLKLIQLVAHAYENVPYYRDIFRAHKLTPGDIKDLKDIEKLPILARDDIKLNFERLKATNVPRYKIRHGHTSGTTGSPLEFLWDVSVCVAHHAADWRQKRWAGLHFGEPFASLQGRQIVPMSQKEPPFWVMNYVHNQLFLSSFHLKENFMGYIVEKLESYNPKVLEGYPSSLYILARYLKRRGLYVRLPAVLTSSETLMPVQRELLEERFECKVFDFYGMAERVVYGSECQSGKRHYNMDYGIMEILGRENEPLEEGVQGKIVATGLWNFAMPLIRYRTSDISSKIREFCPCGCSFPVMDQITTKAEDIVVLPDGRLIPSSILTHPFKPINSIRKSQILQNEPNRLLVKIVPDFGFTQAEAHSLVKGLRERVGEEVEILLECVNEIPASENGKFRWVISKVELP